MSLHIRSHLQIYRGCLIIHSPFHMSAMGPHIDAENCILTFIIGTGSVCRTVYRCMLHSAYGILYLTLIEFFVSWYWDAYSTHYSMGTRCLFLNVFTVLLIKFFLIILHKILMCALYYLPVSFSMVVRFAITIDSTGYTQRMDTGC